MPVPVIDWIAEGVRCSRAAIPIGRLILADTGLYFIPGKRSLAARRTDQSWLSHALSDDDGLEAATFADIAALPPEDQRTAIRDALHIAPPAVTTLVVTGRVITIAADGPALDFTLPPVLGTRLTAWLSRMADRHAAARE